MRLDLFLVRNGYAESRTKAQRLIETGLVTLNGKPCLKPSTKVGKEDTVRVLAHLEFVGRGGYKLDGLLEEFKIEVSGRVACDIGSSTGGFVHCLLKRGASKVYAVDVNVQQLHESLKADKRVVPIQKNARFLTKADFGMSLDIVTVDVSFISVTKLLDGLSEITESETPVIVLIKPQFEIGHPHRGVVTDKDLHVKAIKNVKNAFESFGFVTEYITHSKIKGTDGNIEFFGVFLKGQKTSGKIYGESDIISIVEKAWEEVE